MSDLCIHELFEAQAVETPHAVALVAGDDASAALELSYRQLDHRADRLARRLRSAGIGPESRVGVCLQRGPELLVTLLGVLKAGGAYVPLDPDHPAERLAYLLADSAVSVVVTDGLLARGFAAYSGTVLLADEAAAEDSETAGPGRHDRSVAPVGPGNAAYVMYTSGSTGRPKGVVVPHAGVVNRLRWAQEWFPLAVGDRVLHKTPFSFDVSVPELFWPLANGGAVVMARPGGHRDPRYLARTMAEHRITTVSFVPSMLRAFLAEPVQPLPSLRRILCSGEALTADLVSAAHQRLGCEVYNLYGPTETSVEVTGTLCAPGESVTIGRAVPGVTALVLDEELRLVPDMMEGQLCLAGIQLARGYHGRPGLTAERFMPHPYADVPGERIYLTGDLVRRRPDGAIEYLGRIDRQVKIRGNRVELGEIESVLMSEPAVAAAALVADRESDGGTRLTAHVVPAGETVDIAALRGRLAARLPDYMVPTVWSVLAALPLTTSGKVDRKALPDPGSGRPDLAGAYLAPRTETERQLVAVWEDVLGRTPVGVRDGFLDLGGHSLAATMICARVRRALDCELTVEDLLTAPTVEELAAVVDGADSRPGRPAPVGAGRARESSGKPEWYQPSFAQQRLWLLDQMNPGATDYLMLDAYRLRGPLDVAALRQALDDTIARHDILRATFTAADGVPRLVIREEVPEEVFAAIEADAGRNEADREEATRKVIDSELRRPVRLDHGPLLRLTLLRLDETHHVAVLVIHHIVADDWSLEIFWRDLAAHYRAGTTGTPVELTALPAQYTDYAIWQRSGAHAEELRDRLERRRAELKGVPDVLGLPTDLPRTAPRLSADATVGFELPATSVRAVHDVARAAGATPFMVLLAAFAATLAGLAHQDDFLIGTFAGNRTAIETEPLVGLFVNTLALRMDCDGDPVFAELVGRVRSAALDAYRHQELPFDHLVSALRPPRDLTRNPLVQVAFQLLGPASGRLSLPGVAVSPVRSSQGGNALDCLVTLREEGERLIGELHYRADLFTAATAEAIAARLTRTMIRAAEQPGLRLSDLVGADHAAS
ncbi:amino acid adenylation domain-containing protein [Streptomyces sp. NPDC058683]|uniref:amino acid adenylation domain-containing protein n=1 Tax=Streptomyces sp. NPDC058683 TaxID=3346597 RepID=UPI0036648370